MTQPRPRLRLLHTADVHIGDDTNAGSSARRLAGLVGAVDVALSENVDLLIIAGDFFDSFRVHPAEVEAAWDQLSRLSVPIVLTPGNHDCLEAPSIYDRVRPGEALPHLRFLGDPDGSHIVLEDLSLTLWGRGLVRHETAHFPLLGYRPHLDENWQVAVAHGHHVARGTVVNGSSPVLEEQIAALGCDYLALGHWHTYADVSSNGTPAFYSGSPSDSFMTFASVNLVTLDPDSGTLVERVRID